SKRAAELMAHIFRLDADLSGEAIDQHRLESQRRARPPIVVALVVERVAMQIIRAALGHGVGHAARRAAVFGGIIRGVDLKLTNRRLTDRIVNARAATLFGEERLVIVASIYRVVVQQSRNSSKADQTKGAVGCRAGRQEGEIGPSTPVDGQLVDGYLIDVS